MAGQPFERTALYAREKPLGSDINQAQSQADYTLREMLRRLLAPRTSPTNYGASDPSGFIGTGFQVKAQSPAAMQVVVSAGFGFIIDVANCPASIGASDAFVNAVGIDDLSPLKPLVLMNDITINVPAAPVSNSRIDVIEVNYKRLLTNPLSRGVLNVDLVPPDFDPTLLNKTLTFLLQQGDVTIDGSGAINYKRGTAGVSPSPPALDDGYVAIAHVKVSSGNVTIPNAQIADQRTILFPGGTAAAVIQFTLQDDVTLAPTGLHIVGPPGIPIYVVQDGSDPDTIGVYVLGKFNLVNMGAPQTALNTINAAVGPRIGGLLYQFSDFDTNPATDVPSSRCANPDSDPPATGGFAFNLTFKKQHTSGTYAFDQPVGGTMQTAVTIVMG
jgi:hypothetical protein